ncbi:hypothetical protein HELRODRAFT_168207 [Helobdella robusta]|uniref:RNase H type-1 domain-containing protein n=1 Tax=Helobdella robusta TaxID=6412 RepID=T1F0B2_HELRO|nr:hypothetical protein HELRODRAFT_168207 [Helobdella robusta]ESO09245.1 hypothetical protein HELRODRAFT_168207 [Helobdella robusta]
MEGMSLVITKVGVDDGLWVGIESITSLLQSRQMFSSEDEVRIMNACNDGERIRRFLNTLESKPDATYKAFCNVLELHYPHIFLMLIGWEHCLDGANHHSARGANVVQDSLSAITALNQYSPQHNLIKQIQNNIHNNLTNNSNKIALMWIPSHIGIHGNEEADQLASQAHAIPISNVPIPYSDLRTWAKKIMNEKWQLEWNKINNYLKLSMPSVYKKKNPDESKGLNRKLRTIINRLKIGHSKYTHSWIINKTNPPACNFCDEKLSVQHLVECKNHDDIRKRYQIPSDIEKILKRENINNLITYLQEIKILDRI